MALTAKQTQQQMVAGNNPYLAAKREWNERYGDYIAREKSWRMATIIMGVITLIAVSGLVYTVQQTRLKPYLVMLDRLGSPVGTIFPEQMGGVDERVIKSLLASFITDLRTVSVDSSVQAKFILRAYAFIKREDPAFGYLNSYFEKDENNPNRRAAKVIVGVDINTVLRESEKSWIVEWTETIRDRNGNQKEQKSMKAVLTIKFLAQKLESDVRVNPVGLFVTSLDWQQRI